MHAALWSRVYCSHKLNSTHSYCLGKVFLAFSVAQDAANVEKRRLIAGTGLLKQHAIVESEQDQRPQIEFAE